MPFVKHVIPRLGLILVAALTMLTVPELGVYGHGSPEAQASITEPVRVRMNLDTRNLYLYADSAAATSNLASTSIAGLNADTWLDLSNDANNKASSSTSYCLAVNNNGYTVYVNQNGPVVSCANQTAISRVKVGEARTLTEPVATAAVSAASPTIGTPVTGSITGAANIERQEWILPDGSSSTSSTTSALTYNSTGARTLTLRAVGTKGERISTVTVNPQGLPIEITIAGSSGGTGGAGRMEYIFEGVGMSVRTYMNCPANINNSGVAGSAGGRISGTYVATSLPVTFDFTLGSQPGGSGTYQAAYFGNNGGYYQCRSGGVGIWIGRKATVGYGGAAGVAGTVSVAGTEVASAQGGAGGRGANTSDPTWSGSWNGQAGAAASGTTAGPGLTGATTTTNTGGGFITITPSGGTAVTRTASGTLTVTSATSVS